MDLSLIIVDADAADRARTLAALDRQRNTLRVERIAADAAVIDGRSAGVAAARGDYILFVDPGVIYGDEALAVLWAAAQGVDVGLAQLVHGPPIAVHRHARDCRIPTTWAGTFAVGDVDVASACVRRAVAAETRWEVPAAGGLAEAHDWLTRLADGAPRVRFVPYVIGRRP